MVSKAILLVILLVLEANSLEEHRDKRQVHTGVQPTVKPRRADTLPQCQNRNLVLVGNKLVCRKCCDLNYVLAELCLTACNGTIATNTQTVRYMQGLDAEIRGMEAARSHIRTVNTVPTQGGVQVPAIGATPNVVGQPAIGQPHNTHVTPIPPAVTQAKPLPPTVNVVRVAPGLPPTPPRPTQAPRFNPSPLAASQLGQLCQEEWIQCQFYQVGGANMAANTQTNMWYYP